MARPKKNPEDVKSVDVRIPLTEEQKNIISEAAAAEDVDVAAWARPILMNAAQNRLASRHRKNSR